MSVEYTNVEQACGVLDSVCASPALPSSLYDWQKDAWVYIRAYITESQKTSANSQSMPCSHEFLSGPFVAVCTKCKASFPNRQSH
jgi:hypothetical protein